MSWVIDFRARVSGPTPVLRSSTLIASKMSRSVYAVGHKQISYWYDDCNFGTSAWLIRDYFVGRIVHSVCDRELYRFWVLNIEDSGEKVVKKSLYAQLPSS